MSISYDAFRVLDLNGDWSIRTGARYWWLCRRNPAAKWTEGRWTKVSQLRAVKQHLVRGIQRLGIEVDPLPAALIESMPEGHFDRYAEEARFRAAVAAAAAQARTPSATATCSRG